MKHLGKAWDPDSHLGRERTAQWGFCQLLIEKALKAEFTRIYTSFYNSFTR
jgi:hypothetical protein